MRDLLKKSVIQRQLIFVRSRTLVASRSCIEHAAEVAPAYLTDFVCSKTCF
jgi:hypothetical protein